MKAIRKHLYEPDYAVPPGETLQETLDSLDMSQKDLAVRTGLSEVTINRIVKDHQPITPETANKLELVTGVPARFWNNLESNYREQLAKVVERKQMEADQSWLKILPLSDLLERGEIKRQEDPVSMVRECLSFYGMGSVAAWKEHWAEPKIAARRSPCFETHIGPASAWIRMGERQAQSIDCQDYDKKTFLEALRDIRLQTTESPKVFQPKMVERCAAAGVAVVFVQELKKAPWNGATLWLSPNKAMILMSIRGKGEDRFWFSFFHEAGHILNDGKKYLYVNDSKVSDDPKEKKADAFAADFLIPPDWNESIRNADAPAAIRSIAKKLGIAPGIVAGRYQFLNKKWSHHKNLIRKLEWASKLT